MQTLNANQLIKAIKVIYNLDKCKKINTKYIQDFAFNIFSSLTVLLKKKRPDSTTEQINQYIAHNVMGPLMGVLTNANILVKEKKQSQYVIFACVKNNFANIYQCWTANFNDEIDWLENEIDCPELAKAGYKTLISNKSKGMGIKPCPNFDFEICNTNNLPELLNALCYLYISIRKLLNQKEICINAYGGEGTRLIV